MTTSQDRIPDYFWTGLTLIAVFIAMLMFAWVSFQPMVDADLWWHLKTGDLIIEKGELLSEDPFAFTSEAFSSPREHSILQGYPASQIAYSLLYSLFGLSGLLVFRIFLLSTISTIAARSALKRKASALSIAVILALSWASFYWAHTADRPHIFSFLFFVLLVSSLRPVGRENWLAVPMMLVWANFHGGYITGDLVLIVYLGGRYLDIGWGREFRRSLGWCVACVVASFFNPNGALFLVEVFLGNIAGSLSAGIAEYQSSFAVFAAGKNWVLALWAEILLALIVRIGTKRIIWSEILPLLLFGMLALMYVRMTAFFALGMAPYVAADLSVLINRSRPMIKLAACSLLLIMIVPLAYVNGSDVAGGWKVFWPEENAFYPAESIPFIKSANLQGRMFNDYTWGGYLIWKLYPQYQVFIDGRALDDSLFADYQVIVKGEIAPEDRQYERLLNLYQIEFVVIPIQDSHGSLLPLFTQLYRNPRWSPVYTDLRTVIFVREGGRNADVLSKYRILPAAFFDQVINGFRSRVAANGADFAAWQGGVEFYLASLRHLEARSVLMQALQVAPDYPGFLRLVPMVGGSHDK